MKNYCLFPKSFLWGTATASYQVEGAAAEAGRGPSIWDTFAHSPGRIDCDHNGDISTDQYHRYREDIRLMQWLGVKAYRLSISWSRVFPQGRGKINPKGIAYYERLVDALLAHGIEPWVTLFHWDLPQSLENDFGGWQGRDTAKYFGEYAAAIARRLGDRISNYFTINEFACFTTAGYQDAIFPPGKKLGQRDANQVRHHALLAHGLAVQALRAHAGKKPNVGLAENSIACVPVMETEEHIEAARQAYRRENAHFLTTVLEGQYPDFYLQAEGANAPMHTDEDMAIIGSPLDFVGLNVYTPSYVRADRNAPTGYALVPLPESYPKMVPTWLAIGPQVAYWGPRFVKEIWGKKRVYITENGCACRDRPAEDGEIYDTDRVMYLREHFIAASRAVAEGWPLKGYFVWSLLDNFEWLRGYTQRFGLCYVNYQTLKRTPKLSAKFYREVIRRRVVV